MGDTTISNQRPISAKGNENDIQVNDGSGDLKSIVGLKVSRTGFLSATGFIGDGGLLSNVGGGSGVPGGALNAIQYNAGASTFGGSSNFTFDGTNVSLSGGGMFSGDGGLLSNVGSGSVQPGTISQLAYYSGSTQISNTEGITYSTATNSVAISGNLVVGNASFAQTETLSVYGNVSVKSLQAGRVVYTNSANVLDTNAGFTYDETTGIMGVNSDGGAVLRLLQPVNKFISAVKKGSSVYLTAQGSSGHIDADLTDNADADKLPSVGLAMNAYSLNSPGYVVKQGELTGIVNDGTVFDTVLATGVTHVGKPVYISNGGTGTLTITRPGLNTQFVQTIGVITRVTGGGISVIIQGVGRVTDNPNTVKAVDGYFLERLAIGSNVVNATTNLYVTGNLYADRLYGDGSNLTGISGGTQTFAQVVERGNTTSNTVQFTNADSSLVTSGRVGISNLNPTHTLDIGANVFVDDTGADVIYAAGNIYSTGYFKGDGSLLTNLTVLSSLQSVTDLGNTTSNTVQFTNATTSLVTSGQVGIANSNPTHTLDIGANVFVDDTGADVIYANGNIYTTGYFKGDGSLLTNLTVLSSLQSVTDLGNTTSNTIQFTNSDVSLVTSGQVGISNSNPTHTLDIGANVFVDDTGSNVIYANGNIYTTGYFKGDGSLLTGVVTATSSLQSVTDTGNTTSNTVQFTNSDVSLVTSGQVGISNLNPTHTLDIGANVFVDDTGVDVIYAAGNIYTTGYFKGDGSLLTNLTVLSSLQSVTDLGNTTSNTIQFTNADSSLVTSGRVGIANSNPTHTLDIGANVFVDDTGADVIYANGNIYTTGYFKGDGSLLTNLTVLSSLQSVTDLGNTTSNTIQFTNATTSLVTSGQVGIANSNPTHTLDIGANVFVDDTGADVIYANGNIFTTGYFKGDGSLLTGVVTATSSLQSVSDTGNTTSNTIQFTNADSSLVTSGRVGIANSNPTHTLDIGANVFVDDTGVDVIYATGNVYATGYFKGDGSLLTNLTVLSSLQSVTDLGNTTSNTVQFTNSDVSLVTSGQVGISNSNPTHTLDIGANVFVDDTGSNVIYANGNIYTTGYFKGDGSLLTGVVTATSSLQSVTDTGNTTSNTVQFTNADSSLVTSGRVGVSNLNPTHTLDIGANVFVDDTGVDVIYAAGNVYTSGYFKGDGSLLTNLTVLSSLQSVTDLGNTTSNTVQFTNATTSLVTSGQVGIANSNPTHTLDIGANVFVDDTGSNVIYANGNIFTTGYFKGDGSLLTGVVTAASSLQSVTDTGNTTSNTVQFTNADSSLVTSGRVGVSNLNPTHTLDIGANVFVDDTGVDVIYATGNVYSSGYFKGDGSLLTNLTVLSSLQSVTDLGNTTSNTVQFTNSDVSLVTSGQVGIANSNPTHTLDIGANVFVDDTGSNVIYANGNIYTTGYFKGDGSLLTNLAVLQSFQDVTDLGNTTSNTVQFTNTENSLVTSGRVGIANSSPTHTLDIGANVFVDDAGLDVIYATGNILTTGYFKGDGSLLTNLTVLTSSFQSVTDTGNATSNTVQFTNSSVSFVTSGQVGIANSNPTHTLDIGSNVYVDDTGSNVIYANGNIFTTGYFKGDGSLLTGIATVASSLQSVSDIGNTTSNTVQFTNTENSLVTSGRVGVSNSNPTHTLDIGANVFVDDAGLDVIYATGNILTTGYFKGDGSLLTNLSITTSSLQSVTDTGNTTANTVQFTNSDVSLVTSGQVGIANSNPTHTLDIGANVFVDDTGTDVIYANGNIYTTGYFKGDGSLLTGISAVAASFQSVTDTGNTSSNTVQFTNAESSLVTSGRVGVSNLNPTHTLDIGANVYIEDTGSNVIYADGNVYSAGYFKGDGRFLKGITFGRVVAAGNTTSNTVQFLNPRNSLITCGRVGISNCEPVHTLDIGSRVYVDDEGSNVIYANGNIYSTGYIKGNGSLLTGLTFELMVNTGNITSNTVQFTNNRNSLVTSGRVGIANSNPIHTLDIGANVYVSDTGSNVIYANGDIYTTGCFKGNGSLLTHLPVPSLESVTEVGNTASSTIKFYNPRNSLITWGRVGVANSNPIHTLDIGANVFVDDTGSNVIYANGNVYSTAYFKGDGSLLDNLPVSSLQEITDVGNTASSTVQFTSQRNSLITRGRVGVSNLNPIHTLDIGANVYVSDTGADVIYANGNVYSSGYFKGDGSLLTGISQSLQAVTDTGNTTSNTIQLTNQAGLHFVNNVNVSVGSASGSIAIGYDQNISNVGATYIKPIRNTDEFTSNVLSYTNENELVQNDNIVISTNQVTIGNRTFINLHTKPCNHGATTNVAVFNFAYPHVGIIKADALMIENSNTSTRHMEWLCKNIGGTQVFNTIQAYGSNTSPAGIRNINIYPAKDDTADNNQKFTVGIELMGPLVGTSDVTVSLETIGYAKPYIQLGRII